MSDITKVLFDDHRRVRRAFGRVNGAPGDIRLALEVCSELKIQMAINEELVYPALRDKGNGAAADAAQREHGPLAELIERVEKMEPGDPQLRDVMGWLEDAFEDHVQTIERSVFPAIQSSLKDQLLEVGSEAFAMRQELTENMTSTDSVSSLRGLIANTGWGPSRIPNAGW